MRRPVKHYLMTARGCSEKDKCGRVLKQGGTPCWILGLVSRVPLRLSQYLSINDKSFGSKPVAADGMEVQFVSVPDTMGKSSSSPTMGR